MRRVLGTLISLALMLTLVGCAGMSSTEQRMLSGGAIGAGAGAAIGAATGGSPAAGAAIGGAAGVIGGAIIDQNEKEREYRNYRDEREYRNYREDRYYREDPGYYR